MKTATSIEEQIQLLEERGMIFNDKEKAKEILLDIGYYRLGFIGSLTNKVIPQRTIELTNLKRTPYLMT